MEQLNLLNTALAEEKAECDKYYASRSDVMFPTTCLEDYSFIQRTHTAL